jgi:spore coat polysaccharide biosynthesis protein SpsF (cytidylyltransferase family)/sialic acid synthase SpsE
MNPYIILEIANTHAGDKNYVFNLLEEYSAYKQNFGIKFQPFKYDEIAREDYEWYPVYQTLFFDESTWNQIINKAAETKGVWLDVSNSYSVKILRENAQHVKGIKFQASILDNILLIKELKTVDFSDKTIIINVASLTLEQIEGHLNFIRNSLKAKSIVLQIGFQDYPTQLIHSGISKINTIKDKFKLPISFADHIDGTHQDAIDLPVLAVLMGAEIIEKHVMCSGEKAKYDHFSSVVPDAFKNLVEKIHDPSLSTKKQEYLTKYKELMNQPFVNDREMEYYRKTAMKPTLCRDMQKGQIVSLEYDVNYKRTKEDGLDIESIKKLNASYHVLNSAKKDGEVLKETDFKKAKIASIIACRLKSSRLPQKAILKVNKELSSVELCIKNSMLFKNVDITILATSTSEEDDALKNYTYKKEVIFHKGDPDDVIQRYLDIINKLDIDVFVRITADMPYVSEEIVEFMLNSHFETGADYTACKKAAIGQGVQILNASALRKVREYFPVSDYSEYMNAYIFNNPSLFKINEIDLPKEWIRDYRLTLDYPQDLELIKKIEEHFETSGKPYNINNLFEYLDNNPAVAAINKNCSLIYKVDPQLMETIKKKTTLNA